MEDPSPHPFRRTTGGFESLIPTDRGEDFFFSQWIGDTQDAAEFLEHGDDRDPLLGDPRVGVAVSALAHVFLVAFALLEPNVAELLNLDRPEDAVEVAEDETADPPLLVFVEPPPEAPPAAPAVPAVPVPAPEAAPAEAAPPPQVADNSLFIPKAMLPPDRQAEIMNDLPFSDGNTDEFYTDEEVKDPGAAGEPEPDPEAREALEASDLGEGGEDLVAEEGSGEEDLAGVEPEPGPEREVAETMNPDELKDFVFGENEVSEPDEPAPAPAERAATRRERRRRAEAPRVERGEVGEGGEEGRFTDIRRFLAGARFHNLEGGLVANGNNTLYYNDKGANFVPWIRRMLTEVSRAWRAGMPWAANIYAGHTAVAFTVARDGTVVSYETLKPSGVAGFDNIAVGAIRAADLMPLPSDYPDEYFDIILVFWYNERPYDIFG